MPRRTRTPRPQRGYLDPGYMRSVERLLSERREFESLTPTMLTQAAQVTADDIASATRYWDRANAGQPAEHLLDATTWEGPWDG